MAFFEDFTVDLLREFDRLVVRVVCVVFFALVPFSGVEERPFLLFLREVGVVLPLMLFVDLLRLRLVSLRYGHE